MKNIWKPTKAEVDAIKQAAAREAGRVPVGAVILDPGMRYNTKDNGKNEGACQTPRGLLNIALVSDDPEWNDTDLNDYGAWADFRAGVLLTEDGRAIIDFYIRRRFDEDKDLLGNVTVYYAGGQITRIHGYPGEYPVPMGTGNREGEQRQ